MIKQKRKIIRVCYLKKQIRKHEKYRIKTHHEHQKHDEYHIKTHVKYYILNEHQLKI
jgi:hypothetical protein